MARDDVKNVWLDDIGIVHMGPRDTAAKNQARGATMLMREEIKKLAEILDWLEKEQILNMAFWEWQKIEGDCEVTGTPYKYWRLCPRIMFFKEEDAVYFKITYGNGKN